MGEWARNSLRISNSARSEPNSTLGIYKHTQFFFRVRYDARSEPRCNFPETSVSLFSQTHGNVNVKHRTYTSIYHLYCYVLWHCVRLATHTCGGWYYRNRCFRNMYRLCEWTRQNEHVICIGAVSSAHTKQEQSFKLYKTDVHIFFIIFLDSFVCFLQHIAQNRVFAKEDPSLFSVFFSLFICRIHTHTHMWHTLAACMPEWA